MARKPTRTAAAPDVLTLADDDAPRALATIEEPAAQDGALMNLTPAQMLAVAVQRGDGMEILERLMALRDRWEANEARKAYVRAMAEFKRNPPTIIKDKKVGYENRDGTFTGYTHATLAEVATKIAQGLAAVGISHAWDVRHEGGLIIVSCTLTHSMGHSETIVMPPVAPDDSGKKNRIQQVASAITYQQRYSLLSITGLAAKDQDDDGRAGGGEVITITAEQVQAIEEEVKRLGADRAGFLRALRLEQFGDMRAENFEAALELLRSRKATGKAGTAPPRSKSAQQQAHTAGAAATYKAEALAMLRRKIDATGVPEGEVLERYTAVDLDSLTIEQVDDAIAWLGRIV